MNRFEALGRYTEAKEDYGVLVARLEFLAEKISAEARNLKKIINPKINRFFVADFTTTTESLKKLKNLLNQYDDTYLRVMLCASTANKHADSCERPYFEFR